MRPISTSHLQPAPSGDRPGDSSTFMTSSGRGSSTRPIRPPVTLPIAVLFAIVGTASCAAASPANPTGNAAPPSTASPSAGPPFAIGPGGMAGGTSVQLTDTVSTLQVSGSAEIDVDVDRAQVSFAVETESETADEASRQNAERMESVLEALRDTGVQGLEVETRGYSLRPRYRRPDNTGTREIAGYTASNTVVATMDDPSRAGTLIDAGIGAGANRVASLTFLASDTEDARLEALRRAVNRARREAEAIAGALGMSLGEPLEVSGGADRPSPPGPLRMEMALQASPTPVEPGSQTVSASVTIRYALRDGEP